MIAAGVLLSSLVLLVGWLGYRRHRAAPLAWVAAAAAAPRELKSSARLHSAAALNDVTAIERGNIAATDRLWRLAFGARSHNQPLHRAHRRVRELICAKLEVDTIDPNAFPRRPTLMPQLLKALDDPRAEAEKISRIIAHDPVLAADVLRLANSSLYCMSAAPIETIQRAIVVCGVDALRGILASAMLRPVFRATRTNFPRFPRLLWDRTERAARAAELYAAQIQPQDRFEAQLVALLSALGPLVVYGTTLDAYARVPQLTPDPLQCLELIGALGPRLSHRIAQDWQTSPRLLNALEKSADEPLTAALHVGELLGALSLLESQTIFSPAETQGHLRSAGLAEEVVAPIWARLVVTQAATGSPS